MKKVLIALAFCLAFSGISKAESKVLFDLGTAKVYIPFTSVDTSYLWDFVKKQSLVGGETPIMSWKSLEFTGGAVTSLEGEGTPFVGARLNLDNPAEQWVPLAGVHPGLFAGRDFRNNAWVYGIKASVNIF